MFNAKSKSDDHFPPSDSSSIIGQGTCITGCIDTAGDVRIDGTLKGNIFSKAKVFIGPLAVVEGDIDCRQADIMGTVTGSIRVSEILQVKGKANIDGDLYSNKLMMEPTVTFNGKCHMGGANVVEFNAEVSQSVPLAINE
ncbi:MAG: polymer-forming cytoskeletal protein [Ferruginibacter sp.]